ncbi:MAG TPA: helix-turn-helix transcriptional regulator [Gaiellaceae bacterium]|nr:helix-turn-helix transcriptional regulator [Gaiellaceae bacterium]
MLSADLIREARLRAGITQAELGRRIGRSQSQVARWERGAVTPSFETLLELIRACGFDLSYRMLTRDESYLPYIERALERTPRERVERTTATAAVFRAIREPIAAARG